MSLAAHYRAMARNNAWSNQRLIAACAGLSAADYTAARVSFFPSIAATLQHNLAVDAYYYDGLSGGGRGPAAFDEAPQFADAKALLIAQRALDLQLIAYCDGLADADLARPVLLQRRAGQVDAETVGSILPHLFVHQIHHRGQVHAMLAGTAVKPPQLDEFFLQVDAPARDAQLAAWQLPALR